jgi:hypothetical protein
MFCLVIFIALEAKAISLKIGSSSYSETVTREAFIDQIGIRPWFGSCPTVPDSFDNCPPYYFPFDIVLSNSSLPVIAPQSADFSGATGLLTNNFNNGLGATVFFYSSGALFGAMSHSKKENMALSGIGFNGTDFYGWTIDRIQISQIQAQFTQPTLDTTTVSYNYVIEYFGRAPYSVYLPLILKSF